eukprot:COSAG01_NODE_7985_length_2965_cov_1.040823_2_plen_108_part_00
METPGSQLLKTSAHSLRPTAFWKPWIVCPSLRALRTTLPPATDRRRALSGAKILRVRVEIMQSQKIRNVGKSQRVLIMNDPMISTCPRPRTGIFLRGAIAGLYLSRS